MEETLAPIKGSLEYPFLGTLISSRHTGSPSPSVVEDLAIKEILFRKVVRR